MKSILLTSLIWFTTTALGQASVRDSLWGKFSTAANDTTKVLLLGLLSDVYYTDINPDSAFLLGQQGLKLAESIGYTKGEMNLRITIARASQELGDFETTIKLGYSVFAYASKSHDNSLLEEACGVLAEGYQTQGDYKESMRWASKSLDLLIRTNQDCKLCPARLALIGSSYYGLGSYDSSLVYLKKALSYPDPWGLGWILLVMGRTQEKLDNYDAAFDYYNQSINNLLQVENSQDLPGVYTAIAGLYLKTGKTDSCIRYAKLALTFAQQKYFNKEAMDACLVLSAAYEKINSTDALRYYKLAVNLKDNLYGLEKQRQIASHKFNEELRENEIKIADREYRNRNRTYTLLGFSVCLLVLMIVLLNSNRQKQKTNSLLAHQKKKVESTLSELKSTQAQLIQSEKMASLGELTAGIAHEIQNPLNFVNNFSDLNTELVDELKEELNAGNTEEAISIANDIKENEQKINHHGKRADDIVKGMLQHSRTNTGQKELTDINALADEYVRLAYHGLRAKDKSFNATLKTNFDEAIGNLNIIPQDIGRVVLNLINNAFYAVAEKNASTGSAGHQYEPSVSISTKKVNDKVLIVVKDNGNGIPQRVIDKIFQPFFTTKPTGQGTGLGLSLSYDIIKAHGGEIKVETNVSEGAEFIVQLPFKENF
jgi:two-component system NtrC family sensor kinase